MLSYRLKVACSPRLSATACWGKSLFFFLTWLLPAAIAAARSVFGGIGQEKNWTLEK